jgi:hypothetical protein
MDVRVSLAVQPCKAQQWSLNCAAYSFLAVSLVYNPVFATIGKTYFGSNIIQS